MTPKVIAKVKDWKETTNLSTADIAKRTGIGRTIVYRILKTKLGYVSSRLVKSENLIKYDHDENPQKKISYNL